MAGGLPQVRFATLPVRVVETAQNDAEAIIREFRRTERLPEKALQSVSVSLSPILNAHLAVVGFGQDESNPDRSQTAIGKPTMQMMTAQMPFQNLWQMELLYQTE